MANTGPWSPFATLAGSSVPKPASPGTVRAAHDSLFGPETRARAANAFDAAVAAPIPADVFTFGAAGLSPGKAGARAPADPGGGPSLGNPVTAGTLASNMVGTLGPAPGLSAGLAHASLRSVKSQKL